MCISLSWSPMFVCLFLGQQLEVLKRELHQQVRGDTLLKKSVLIYS